MTISQRDLYKILIDKGVECEFSEDKLIVNGGYVDLRSLTSLPEGVEFRNGGYVDLRSLTSLPEGVEFRNGGYVGLRSLTSPNQTYMGESLTFRYVDGNTMILGARRELESVEVFHAKYFGGGPIEDLRQCYLAFEGEYSAHGETIREAIQDLRFKKMENCDDGELRSGGTCRAN